MGEGYAWPDRLTVGRGGTVCRENPHERSRLPSPRDDSPVRELDHAIGVAPGEVDIVRRDEERPSLTHEVAQQFAEHAAPRRIER